MNSEKCPLCGNGITNDELKAVKAKLNEENKRAMEEHEIAIRKQLSSENKIELAAQRVKIEAESRKQADGLKQQNTVLTKKLSQITAAQVQFKEQVDKANAERLQIEIEKKELANKKALGEQRKLLDDAKSKDIAKLKSEHRRENEAMEKKVFGLQRQLEDKSATTIGNGAEIDLYEELRREFPADQIVRVPKGANGADIHHDVLHNGKSCGRIVYESKNCQKWFDRYATKLRNDQIAADGAHAILSSTVFPKNQIELTIHKDVIVVHPARVIFVASILRTSLIELAKTNASDQDRTAKTHRLYDFIRSPQFQNRLGQATKYTDDLLHLEVEFKNQFDNMARKRSEKIVGIKDSVRDLQREIGMIIGGDLVPVSVNGSPCEGNQTSDPAKPR